MEKRPYTKHQDRARVVEEAVAAIQGGLSFRKASEQFGIAKSTLQDFCQRQDKAWSKAREKNFAFK